MKNTILIVSLNAIALTLGLIAADTSLALSKEEEDSRAPIGCKDTGYEFEFKTLHLMPGGSGKEQSMYLLFNNSSQAITLYQMRKDESSRSMYLNHAINAKQWGVFATNERQLKFICTTPEAKNTYGKIVDCAEHFRICEYTNVRFGLNNQGNYWLVNSSTRNGAVKEIVHYGIIPGQ